MTPLADTRAQSIADSVQNYGEIQKTFPDIDFTSSVIEPTVNLTFNIQVK